MKYLIYIFLIVSAVLLGLLSVRYKSSNSAIIAEVEPRSYAVSFQNGVRVKEIYVMPGQNVKKGDKLVKVERVDLQVDYERLTNELKTLQGTLELRELEKKSMVNIARMEYELGLALIETEKGQLDIVMSNNESLAENLRALRQQSDTANLFDQSYQQLTRKQLEKRKKILEDQYRQAVEKAEQEYLIATHLARNEIGRVKLELELLEKEEKELVQYAHVDGAIGIVYAEVEELIPPYTTVMSLYQDDPTVIRALMHETKHFDVAMGDVVLVESANRNFKIEGRIVEIGSRVVEYPERLRTFREVPMWGQELFIKIPEQSGFLSGEKVFVLVKKKNGR